MEAICAGLNVLELGSGSAAASIAGVILADAGAQVIKIEAPDGDRLRTENPNGFLVWNRGKDSVVADLHTTGGQDRLRELVRSADVVIEGFAPGTTDAWGVGPDALRALNPALIHCSITGFGKTGAYSGLKGYDSLVAAKVGLWARGSWGHRDGPIMFPVPWASYGAGMQSVAGILGALLVREKTGRGQKLDATLVAGLDPIDYFVSTVVQLMAKKGESTGGDSRSLTGASRFGVLVATRDGRFIQTSTMLPHQGKALCEVAGIGRCHRAGFPVPGVANVRQRGRRPGVGGHAAGSVSRQGLRALASVAAGQPRRCLRGRGYQRGGARPPSDRAQRRRHRRRGRQTGHRPRGRADRPLREDSDRHRAVGPRSRRQHGRLCRT